MYKYYKKGEKYVMHYKFDSISEFLNYIENAETSKVFKERYLSSFNTSNTSWYGTNNFDEAVKLAKFGYNENFERFKELKIKLEKYIKLSSKKKARFNDMIGYAPNVPAYLIGSPINMFNQKNGKRKQINVYYNVSNSCGVSSNQILNKGIITLNIVEMLERIGYDVNLKIFEMSYRDNQVFYQEVNLKNVNERVNLKKVYFPMCHPSWLRRLIFRLKEVVPDARSSWTDGYGYPGKADLVREILDLDDSDIVISNVKELGIQGKDLVEDLENVISYINKTNKIEEIDETKKIR